MKVSIVLLAACALCLPALSVQASILSKHITFDGIPDIMEDDSRASVFDPGGDSFSVGDVIYGFVSISDFTPSGDPSPDEIAVLFAAEIYGSAPNGTFQLGPVLPGSNGGANAAFTLSALIGPGALLPKVGAAAPAGAMVSDAIGVIVSNTGVDPLSPELGSLAAFNAAFGYEGTIGVDPASVITGAGVTGDFFHFFPTPPPFPAPGSLLGAETAGFSVFDSPFAPSVGFLGVPAKRLDNGVTSFHDVELFEGSVFANSDTTSPWAFTDNSNFTINATPEPASLLVWAGIASIVCVFCKRRRLAP